MASHPAYQDKGSDLAQVLAGDDHPEKQMAISGVTAKYSTGDDAGYQTGEGAGSHDNRNVVPAPGSSTQ